MNASCNWVDFRVWRRGLAEVWLGPVRGRCVIAVFWGGALGGACLAFKLVPGFCECSVHMDAPRKGQRRSPDPPGFRHKIFVLLVAEVRKDIFGKGLNLPAPLDFQ